MMLQYSSAGQSDIGRRRETNEDAFFADDHNGLYIVCDGMGGHAAGEVAACLALATAVEVVQTRSHELLCPSDALGGRMRAIVDAAVQTASGRVFERAQSDGEAANMGCTMTLALLRDGQLAMAHVGDSRLYLARGNDVQQLSTDHTVAYEMLRIGLMSEQQLRGHRYTHILSRAVGPTPTVNVETRLAELLPGDRLLLCSDGYSNYLNRPAELATKLASAPPERVARKLVDAANEAGGSDNITVIVVACSADEAQFERPARFRSRRAPARRIAADHRFYGEAAWSD